MRTPELLSDPAYHDEDEARAYLESERWANGRPCPHCGVLGANAPVGGPSMGPGWYYCSACKDKFTVRTGTVMGRSHIPLHKWLLAIRLMTSSKKGISSHQLHRTLGITYKSAWFLSHRIREAMDEDVSGPIGGEGKTVEADETYVVKQRGRAKWEFSNDRGWVKTRDRREITAFALVERGGRARTMLIDGATTAEQQTALKQHADTKSKLMTDEWRGYRLPGREFASHESVNHSQEEWTRGEVHTQSVENFFSVFKRGMKGVYQHCSEKHLARYLHEFAFRHSHRVRLGINDVQRVALAIKGMEGKRLTYRWALSHAASAV